MTDHDKWNAIGVRMDLKMLREYIQFLKRKEVKNDSNTRESTD